MEKEKKAWKVLLNESYEWNESNRCDRDTSIKIIPVF